VERRLYDEASICLSHQSPGRDSNYNRREYAYEYGGEYVVFIEFRRDAGEMVAVWGEELGRLWDVCCWHDVYVLE
jgi:hypothetical protein